MEPENGPGGWPASPFRPTAERLERTLCCCRNLLLRPTPSNLEAMTQQLTALAGEWAGPAGSEIGRTEAVRLALLGRQILRLFEQAAVLVHGAAGAGRSEPAGYTRAGGWVPAEAEPHAAIRG